MIIDNKWEKWYGWYACKCDHCGKQTMCRGSVHHDAREGMSSRIYLCPCCLKVDVGSMDFDTCPSCGVFRLLYRAKQTGQGAVCLSCVNKNKQQPITSTMPQLSAAVLAVERAPMTYIKPPHAPS